MLNDNSDANDFYTIRSQASFPQHQLSGFTFYGLGGRTIVTKQAAIGTARYTFSLLDIQRGLGVWPLFFGRLSGAFVGQTAALRQEDLPRAGVPLSGGFELYQAITPGHIFQMTAKIGIYRGSQALGNETEVIFSLSTGD